jgi:hypothetical protein
MKRVVSFLVSIVLLVTFFGTAITLQHRALERVKLNPTFFESWQLRGRSGDVLKHMALGYDLIAADFLWLRAIQSFGGRGMTNRDWKPLYNLFDTITELDPQFADAYTFGNMVIGDEGGKQREALGLIDKGTFKVLDSYRIPFEGMYVAHWELKDLPLARWYGRMAMKRKDCPDWVPRMVAYLDVESGAYYVGLDRFIGNLAMAFDAKDSVLEGISLGKIKEAINKWNLSLLTTALEQYTTSTGKLPEKIEDIANQPALQNYEVARVSRLIAVATELQGDFGREGFFPFNLQNTALPDAQDAAYIAANPPQKGSAKKMTDLQNVLFRSSLVKQSGIPQDPYGGHYDFNRALLGAPNVQLTEVISDEKSIVEFLQSYLAQVRAYLNERKEQLGHPPSSLREAFYTDFKTTEPFGGRWIYDPSNGSFKSSTHPTL